MPKKTNGHLDLASIENFTSTRYRWEKSLEERRKTTIVKELIDASYMKLMLIDGIGTDEERKIIIKNKTI